MQKFKILLTESRLLGYDMSDTEIFQLITFWRFKKEIVL